VIVAACSFIQSFKSPTSGLDERSPKSQRGKSATDPLSSRVILLFGQGGDIVAKVLLVDDEEHICTYYSEELSEEGHEVFTLLSGHKLLEKIDLLRPEVVVLDIRLVDYDGLELLQEIRNRYHDLPVILCSAYDTYKGDQKSIAADYYVIKSFDLSELKMAIQRAIEADTSIWPPKGNLSFVRDT
jgi:CheY-like chemotaxis protein